MKATANKSVKRYYAIVHDYGYQMRDEDGSYIGTCFSFPSKAARDAWTEEGPDYLTDPGVRVAYSTRELRRYWIENAIPIEKYTAQNESDCCYYDED